MRLRPLVIVALLFCFPSMALADQVTLKFEGLLDYMFTVKSGAPSVNYDCFHHFNPAYCGPGQPLERIRGFYGGGAGEYGSTGPNYGVTFSDSARAGRSWLDGGTLTLLGDFPGPTTGLYFYEGDYWVEGFTPAPQVTGPKTMTMSVAAGFTSLSFKYASRNVNGMLNIYDAEGNIVTTRAMPGHANLCSDGHGGKVDCWTEVTLDNLAGATMAEFWGENGVFLLDNLTLDINGYHAIMPWEPIIPVLPHISLPNIDLSNPPATYPMSLQFRPVPEPASLLLLGSGLALCARRVARRRH